MNRSHALFSLLHPLTLSLLPFIIVKAPVCAEKRLDGGFFLGVELTNGVKGAASWSAERQDMDHRTDHGIQ